MPISSENNPIKRLRFALHLTQAELAARLDLSLSAVQGYESGRSPSDSARERLAALAMENNLVQLAALMHDLGHRPFEVKRIYEPPQTGKIRLPHKGSGVDMADRLHDTLDQILNSGRVDLITTLDSVLEMAAKVLVIETKAPDGGAEGKKKK